MAMNKKKTRATGYLGSKYTGTKKMRKHVKKQTKAVQKKYRSGGLGR